MKPILIKDPINLRDIEDAISLIRANPGRPIQLPKNSFGKRRGAMNDASRLQMLVTWARHAEDEDLYFHAENSIDSVLSELCDYSPGIAALRLANGVIVGDVKINRRNALLSATEKMANSDDANFSKIINGRSIDFICVSGSSVQFLKPLFSARTAKDVKSKSKMQQFMRTLVNFVNKNNKESVPESFIKALGIFTHELFLNTQEHATSDHKWDPYTAHIEGLIVSWKQLEKEMFESDFNGHERLKDFWNRELRISGNDGNFIALRCLEVSFFDSGPGFASRATGVQTDELDLDSESNALINCLKKNTTTKDQPGAGIGLPIVLEELRDVGGLIRIRSGRKAVFNAFSPKDEAADLYDFQNWSNDELGCAEGTVVSILIPLRGK